MDLQIENSFESLQRLETSLKSNSQRLVATTKITPNDLLEIKEFHEKTLTEYRKLISSVKLVCAEDDARVQIRDDQLQVTRNTYRNRLRACEQAMANNNRDALLQTNNASAGALRKRQNKQKTSAITEWTAINQTMQASVTQGAQLLESLKEQKEKNVTTLRGVTDMKNNIDDGEHLITKYKQRARTDRIVINLGVFTFFLTCAYIILKRVFGFFL